MWRWWIKAGRMISSCSSKIVKLKHVHLGASERDKPLASFSATVPSLRTHESDPFCCKGRTTSKQPDRV